MAKGIKRRKTPQNAHVVNGFTTLFEWAVQRLDIDFRHGSRVQQRARNVGLVTLLPLVSSDMNRSFKYFMRVEHRWKCWYEQYALTENGKPANEWLKHVTPMDSPRTFYHLMPCTLAAWDVPWCALLTDPNTEQLVEAHLKQIRHAVRHGINRINYYNTALHMIATILEKTASTADSVDISCAFASPVTPYVVNSRPKICIRWIVHGCIHRKVSTLYAVAQHLLEGPSQPCAMCAREMPLCRHMLPLPNNKRIAKLQVEGYLRCALNFTNYGPVVVNDITSIRASHLELEYWRQLMEISTVDMSTWRYCKTLLWPSSDTVWCYHELCANNVCSEGCRRRMLSPPIIKLDWLRTHKLRTQTSTSNDGLVRLQSEMDRDSLCHKVSTQLESAMQRNASVWDWMRRAPSKSKCEEREVMIILRRMFILDTLILIAGQKFVYVCPFVGVSLERVPGMCHGWRSMQMTSVRTFLLTFINSRTCMNLLHKQPNHNQDQTNGANWSNFKDEVGLKMIAWVSENVWSFIK